MGTHHEGYKLHASPHCMRTGIDNNWTIAASSMIVLAFFLALHSTLKSVFFIGNASAVSEAGNPKDASSVPPDNADETHIGVRALFGTIMLAITVVAIIAH